MIYGPDRIRTGDLLLRKQSHYPSYATSPKSFGDLRLIWIAISSEIEQKCKESQQIHEKSMQLAMKRFELILDYFFQLMWVGFFSR